MKIRTALMSAATIAVLAVASPAFAKHSSEAAQNAAEAKTTAQLNQQQLAASGGTDSSGMSGATNATANPNIPSNERGSTAAGYNSPDANGNVNSSTSTTATPGATTDQNSMNTGATAPNSSTSTSSDSSTTTAPK